MPAPLTQHQVLERFKQCHGDRYDYSLVDFKRVKDNVTIICKAHGEFPQTPDNHFRSKGCPDCGGTKKLTLDDFVRKSKVVHGYRYDYSKVDYLNNETNVTIICPIHGEFSQTPSGHMSGAGCAMCYGNAKLDTETFISKAIAIHGAEFDYSRVNYTNYTTEVEIVCPKHGVFKQTPCSHLAGCKCGRCSGKVASNTEWFKEDAKAIHGEEFDYSLVDYIYATEKVDIICKIHGVFPQTPQSHLAGHKCPHCTVYGFRKDKPSIFYIYYCTTFIGFGKSSSPKSRLSKHRLTFTKEQIKYKLIDVVHLDGLTATELENAVKKHFKQHRVITNVKGFKTENVNVDQLGPLLSFVNEFLAKEKPPFGVADPTIGEFTQEG